MTALEKFWQDVQDVLPPSSVGYETATKLGIAYEQAKEMEKEQIKDAYYKGGDDLTKMHFIESEQYYNKTFKQQEQ